MKRALTPLLLVLCACPSSEADVDPVVAQRNCEVYVENCAGCHGEHGHGDGIHGEHLDPAPTNFVGGGGLAPDDPQWLAVVRDGRPEADMPAFSMLLSEADMQATADHVTALRSGSATVCTGAQETSGDVESHGTDDHQTTSTGEPGTTASSDPGSSDETGPGDSTGDGVASTTGDGSTTTSDEPSAECVAWCDCLSASCSDLGDYPFASSDACHEDCATRTDEEIACWQGFCDSVVDNPALADHNCAHAWGELGLAEC